ncbi:MAG: Uma2 family endonuclease [Verrucomicrobiota bacterium]|nr:Uma2 family endonuclease [Verrucomicrobiota bacterium]
MQAVTPNDFVSVDDYLAREEASNIRHEYLGGIVYAMAGETTVHNQISQNLLINIRQHLRGDPCRIFISDIRVNFKIGDDEYYYYPDIIVTCDKRDTHERFVRFPKLIIEVSSPSTERIDRREKFFAYTSIGSLEEYVLVPQKGGEFTVFRRANNWREEKISSDNLTLESLQWALPRASVYDGI